MVLLMQIKGGCCFLLWLIILPTIALSSIRCNRHRQCGEVSIPFPFGTSQDCCLNKDYLIHCNRSFNPPKPFLRKSNIEITNISLDGQLTVKKLIAHACYDRVNHTRVSNVEPKLYLARPFTVNNTANKFIIVGCDVYGFIYGHQMNRSGRTYETGCMAFCFATGDLTPGPCAGLGCCQVSIPTQVTTVNLSLGSFNNYTRVNGTTNYCSYAFIVQESVFSFHPQNLTNLRGVKRLPMVVDWVVGNETSCDEAKANTSSYACKSNNSMCNENGNGYGYRCSCYNGYEGNPYLTDGCQDINECNKNLHDCFMPQSCVNTIGNFTCRCPKGYHGDGRKNGTRCTRNVSLASKLATWVSLAAVVLLLSAYLLYFELRRRRSIKIRQKFFHQNGGLLLQEKLNTSGRSSDVLRICSEVELKKATDNFHNRMIIGQGGYGTVFKGTLTDKRVVAVKKSKRMDVNQVEQFINEIYVLSQINHRNVVKILGCCLETEVPLLVYEFIDNGTLFQHIHCQVNLSWDLRLKIAAETAGVLSYLHSAASPPIIHRDIKTANVLLDHTYTAKVSDFGASRLVPTDESQISTMVLGTLGYLDPEYMLTSQLTEKSDVYSFGVVLVELLTSKKVLNYDQTEKDRSLAHLFLSAMNCERLFEILDRNLRSEKHEQSVIKVALLAKSCLNVRGKERPSMKEVALELEGLRTKGKQRAWDQSTRHNEEDMKFLLSNTSFSIDTGFDSLQAESIESVMDAR